MHSSGKYGGDFGWILVLAMVGLFAIIVGLSWLIWWVVSHLQWVSG